MKPSGNLLTKEFQAVVRGAHEHPSEAPTYDEKEDFREFNRGLKRVRHYVGFGDEAIICGSRGILQECENRHYLLKRLVCGREWCPVCGQDGSEFHKRRIMRLVDRIFSMDMVGYFVFEVPTVARKMFEDVGMLRKARHYLHLFLSREFPGLCGLSRWHFYGDAVANEFSGELELKHYHPHLNILINHGYISKKQLRRVRRLWSQWVYRECGKRYHKIAPVYYRYNKAPGKKWHLITYISRSTFKQLTDTNRHIASDLFNFKNTSWFGVFTESAKTHGRERFQEWCATLRHRDKRPIIEVAAHEAFNSHKCPICGSKTRQFEQIENCSDHTFLRVFGGGLYEVRAPPWSWVHDPDGGLPDFIEANCDFWYEGG